jgi:hypothetical protein
MNMQVQDYTPNPEGPFPPLPDPLPPFPEPPLPFPFPQPFPQPFPPVIPQPPLWPPFQIRSLRCGCYLVNYKPNGSSLVTFDGTMRVECHGSGRTASGDLYQRPILWLPNPPRIPPFPPFPPFPPLPPIPILLPGPNPASGIPILSRNQYRYYLRVTQILEYFTFGNSFTLGFEMHRFTKASGPWSSGGTWANEGAFTAQMSWQAAPAGYPSGGDYLSGDVKNSSGTVVGKLTMGWVSSYLRKATIELDRVSQSEALLNNGAGETWTTIGNAIGWDLTVDESSTNITEPSGESWSDAECHAEMLASRDASNLDAEWRYHVLAVRRLDSTSRGIMYDAYGGDSNSIPREGCVVASHWTIPNTNSWGLVQGMRFGTATGPYFRTAVHETGHAMGLYHNTADLGFMNTTDVIANASLNPGSLAFPNNVQWSYNGEDAKRLRHMPDIYVRPGGVPFGTSYASTPISPTDMSLEVNGLELRVVPLLEAVPLGAPVRVNIELVNVSDQVLYGPSTLSMKSGLVKGSVAGPTGAVRTFQPILLCVEEVPLEPLEPGQSIHHSLTLLRGGQGALFAMPGPHRIQVVAHWDVGGIEATVVGEADVMVTSAVDDEHAEIALRVLTTPDTLLTLVFGGDHLEEGIETIQAAVENSVLKPHFAFIEAKRIGERFGKRKANLRAASQLIEDSTVMSHAEIKRAAEIVKAEGGDNAASKNIANVLKNKADAFDAGDEVKELVDSL